MSVNSPSSKPCIASACYSACGEYRYFLDRIWDLDRPKCCFLMLNPGTATEFQNDPTVRRCMGYAERWGFGGLVVANIFALRSTDPKALYIEDDPVGPDNDLYIRRVCEMCPKIIAAWGNHGRLHDRGDRVFDSIVDRGMRIHCFGLTKLAQPVHPLYLKSDREPIRWVVGKGTS